jgi:tetratricopeptide (TPR) repeat protein
VLTPNCELFGHSFRAFLNIGFMSARAATPEEVRTQLERILRSREFASAPRLSGFLRFVVETTLAGRSGEIKESLIAVEVYGRPADYNPQIDSTVRVEAGRLRARLAKWYGSEGRTNSVRIDLPKGGYVPVFHRIHAPRRLPAVPAVAALGILAAVFLWSRTGAQPPDAETMDIYHRAQDLLRIPVHKDGPLARVPDTVPEAVHLFRAVTKRSPEFAKGWTGLAEAAEWEYELRGNQPKERLAEAKAAAVRAVQIDPRDAEAWTVLTSIAFFRERDLKGAEQAARRALELQPRNVKARQRYIDILRAQGRRDEARAELERTIAVQPAAAALRVRRGTLFLEDGQPERALAEAREGASLTNLPPAYPAALWLQGVSLEQLGRTAEAEEVFRKALQYLPHDPWAEPALAHLLARTGRGAEAESMLAHIRSHHGHGRLNRVAEAVVQTALGRVDAAVAAVERAWQEGDDDLLLAALDPRLQPLRSDSRFQAVFARLRS